MQHLHVLVQIKSGRRYTAVALRGEKLQASLALDCSSSINFKLTAACVGTAKQHLVKGLYRPQIAFNL